MGPTLYPSISSYEKNESRDVPDQNPKDSEHRLEIQNHQQVLRSFIYMICPNHSAADDILQETNRVLWEKRASFEPGTNFHAWSRKVAQFQVMSFQKKFKTKSWLRFDSDLVQSLAAIASSRTEFDQERSVAMTDCLTKLSAADRELIAMKYGRSLSLREISLKTSRSDGALKQVYFRIRQQLKKCIQQKTG